ncbi:NADP-dependent phosphogluconate dehydrogenase, partial [Acinetobacter baumannii]
MDLHVPIPTVDAAVSARDLSGMKDERLRAAQVLKISSTRPDSAIVDSLRQALEVAFTVTYAQGLEMLRVASSVYG